MTARLLTTADAAAWRAALPARACVMGCLELAGAKERQTGCEARLLVVELGPRDRVAYPFLLRPVAPLHGPAADGLHDTFTPEYTGPIRLGPGPAAPDEPARFAAARAACFRALGVVAEFAHLSPWHAGHELLDAAGLEVDREVVWLDLTWGEEGIWSRSFNGDARRLVKQARRAGVRVRAAASREDVLEFHRLHAETMRRREAGARYRITAEHLLALHEAMPEHARIVLAEHEGHAVAGGLFFYDDTDVYWHLSAADLEHARVRPVNAYVHETVRWAIAAGRRRMLCGGGHAPGDGVFRFKASLSPLRAQFRVYKRVHDEERYVRLLGARGPNLAAAPSRFFPAYRELDHAPGA